MSKEWKRGDWQKKLWNGIHQEEENEVDLNLPGRKGLEDWWEKRGKWKKTGMTEATGGRRLYRVFNLKVDRILIWVIYLLRFTTYHITELTCIYSKCWKWCPFISMHLSTRFTMFLATFLSVLLFFNHFRNSTFYWPSVFPRNFVYSGRKTSFLNNFPK